MDSSNYDSINSDLSCCLQSLSSRKITERKVIKLYLFIIHVYLNFSLPNIINF